MGILASLGKQHILIRLAQIGIGLIFIAAGLAKIADIGRFAEQLHNFRMMPVFGENLLAMTLPWVEIVAGLALVLKLRARAAALLATLLMLVFTIGVAQAMARGLDFECGCFGKADATRTGWTKLFQNIGMTLLAWVASIKPR